MLNRMAVHVVAAVIGGALICPAAETFYYMPLKDIHATKGALPVNSEADAKARRIPWNRMRQMQDFMWPYAVVTGGEAYVVSQNQDGWRPNVALAGSVANTHLAVRVGDGAPPTGKIFLPKPDWTGMAPVSFVLDAPNGDQERARIDFLQAKETHYRRLLDLGLPGAAWYRHQAERARREREGEAEEGGSEGQPGRQRPRRESELERTYSLFSGGRAVSENIQLDRELRVTSRSEADIDIALIEGITTAEIDWKQLTDGLDPVRDPLAAAVPHDQHALFFPSFEAMLRLIDESSARGTPILRLMEPRAEDARTREQYERQLCLSTDKLARTFGPALVAGIAFTGSDPYLRTGSDVAVLLESKDRTALLGLIAAAQATALAAGAQPATGEVSGVRWQGVATADRAICSYVAAIDNVVVVSNSVQQIERVVRTKQGSIPALGSLDEYTFFRDRYKRGEEGETAFLMLSDATIRRWCGPKWRIGASRRVRVAAALAELQARNLRALADSAIPEAGVKLEHSTAGAGELTLTATGVTSSVYGSLDFLTPVAELQVHMVTKEERDAYARFRQSYQRQWRNFFDPIAVRFVVAEGTVQADLSVRPLIAASEYRDFMSVTGTQRLGPEAGDPHAEALAQFVMAVDVNAEPVRRFGNFAMQMAPGIGANALNWVGQWLTVYGDADPFWQEMAAAAAEGVEADEFMEENFWRAPVALHIDVANAFKLTAFLATLRGFIEQTAPGMTLWETRKHAERSYVVVCPSEEARDSAGGPEALQKMAIYYAVTGKALVLTLNEPLLKRAIERLTGQKAVPGTEPDVRKPWLGASVAARGTEEALKLIQLLYNESMTDTLRQRSWGNTLILNEWRRFGAEDGVAFHRRFWQTTLVCPGGGIYRWDEDAQSYESSVFGSPASPARGEDLPDPLRGIGGLDLGLTFEGDGLRARATVQRK